MCKVAPSNKIAPKIMSDQKSAFCRSAATPEPMSATRRPFSPWNSNPKIKSTSNPRNKGSVATLRKLCQELSAAEEQ